MGNGKQENFRDNEQKSKPSFSGRSIKRQAVIEGFGEEHNRRHLYVQVKISASSPSLEAGLLSLKREKRCFGSAAALARETSVWLLYVFTPPVDQADNTTPNTSLFLLMHNQQDKDILLRVTQLRGPAITERKGVTQNSTKPIL